MNGKLAEVYIEAMDVKMTTLERMDVWNVVKQESWTKVINGTWEFKSKCFLDGTLNKLKVIFYS